ncbi:hypothetical protein C8R47DRAFT_1085075 [Mycena vitilis]|nr:hypothetical protein C8R47DRAFT_1085075 [Mycena vitilis]
MCRVQMVPGIEVPPPNSGFGMHSGKIIIFSMQNTWPGFDAADCRASYKFRTSSWRTRKGLQINYRNRNSTGAIGLIPESEHMLNSQGEHHYMLSPTWLHRTRFPRLKMPRWYGLTKLAGAGAGAAAAHSAWKFCNRAIEGSRHTLTDPRCALPRQVYTSRNREGCKVQGGNLYLLQRAERRLTMSKWLESPRKFDGVCIGTGLWALRFTSYLHCSTRTNLPEPACRRCRWNSSKNNQNHAHVRARAPKALSNTFRAGIPAENIEIQAQHHAASTPRHCRGNARQARHFLQAHPPSMAFNQESQKPGAPLLNFTLSYT